MFPSLKKKVKNLDEIKRNALDRSDPVHSFHFPPYLHVIARQWDPNLGRLWVEEETPPPVDISRSFRREKRLKIYLKHIGQHPRETVCAQKGFKKNYSATALFCYET